MESPRGSSYTSSNEVAPKLLDIDVRPLFSASALPHDGRQAVNGRCSWMNNMSMYGGGCLSIRALALQQPMFATLHIYRAPITFASVEPVQ